MHDQSRSSVRFEWGPVGATAVSRDADVAVVVDVLSFTTTVSVALDRGVAVIPCADQDEAAGLAREHGARLAVRRAGAGPGDVSLSPASMRAAVELTRVVLPSPNGAAISARLAGAGCDVVAASLRNRTAVARWLRRRRVHEPDLVVAVVAAGERWPDGSLRPAVEDLWGAGAVLAGLTDDVPRLSPEARAAVAAWQAVDGDLAPQLCACSSGRELIDPGYGADVEIAAELDAGLCVPLLTGPAFVPAD